MIISEQYSLKDYAKPTHKYELDQVKEWAKEAEELMNADGNSYKTDVRISQRQTHIYVDVTKNNDLNTTIEPTMMGEKISSAKELAEALYREIASREKSLGYIRGEVDGSVFENKFQPHVEESYNPTIASSDEHAEEVEEDRAC